MRSVGANADSYGEAADDLEATFDYARASFPGRPIILWGSSYSAALVIRPAAHRSEEVVGVIAFSPASGAPMDGCRPEEAAATLTVPAMMLRPASEVEIESVSKQLERFSEQGHRTFVSQHGVHGSSMLNRERTGRDNEATWDAVLSFLNSLSDP